MQQEQLLSELIALRAEVQEFKARVAVLDLSSPSLRQIN